eukprot:s2908_g8.t1
MRRRLPGKPKLQSERGGAQTALCGLAALLLLTGQCCSFFLPSPDNATVRRAAATEAATATEVAEWRRPPGAPKPEQRWGLWPALPIAPYERRVTLRYEVIPGELWTFEQKQGILYIHVPIRMTVYRMQTRPGLFVYAPVAPTEECVRLLRELEEQYGEVAYIVLPTVAVEHKYFVGPFSQAFPKAEVWVCPGQFSVPLQLPLPLLGFPWDARLRTLPKDTRSSDVPDAWQKEGLDFRILGPVGKDLNNGPFAEAVDVQFALAVALCSLEHCGGEHSDCKAFYIRRPVSQLRTMLVTDLVVSVPAEPPEIVAEEPRALAFHARDDATQPLEASDEALLRGWRRMALFALFFQSSAIEPEPVSKAVEDALNSPAKDLGWGGLLPWSFREDGRDWKKSFDALRGPFGSGGLVVAPILSELILNRYLSSDVWPFVEDIVSSWDGNMTGTTALFAALLGQIGDGQLSQVCGANTCALCCSATNYNCSLPGQEFLIAGQYTHLTANYLSYATETSSPHFRVRAREFQECTGGRIIFSEALNVWEDPIRDLGTKDSPGLGIYHAYMMSYSHYPEASYLGLVEPLHPRLARFKRWDATGDLWLTPSFAAAVYACRRNGTDQLDFLLYDGDFFVPIIRLDLLERDNLPLPNTWDEVLALAERYNGTDLNEDGEPDFGLQAFVPERAEVAILSDMLWDFMVYTYGPATADVDVAMYASWLDSWRSSQLPPDGGYFIQAGWSQEAYAEHRAIQIWALAETKNGAFNMRLPGAKMYTFTVLATEMRYYIADAISLEEVVRRVKAGWDSETQERGKLDQLAIYRATLGLDDLSDTCQQYFASFLPADYDLCLLHRTEMDSRDPTICPPYFPDDNDFYLTALIVILTLLVVSGILSGVAYVHSTVQAKKRLEKDEQLENTVLKGLSTVKELGYPMSVIRAKDFVDLTSHMLESCHEGLRDLGLLREISHFHMMGNHIVFFSYHWPSWNRQGPDNIQRRAMDHALKLYGEKVGATLENMYDIVSIPQKHRGVQVLAINSLYVYASSVDALIIIAPPTLHEQTGQPLGLDTYKTRVWTRVEQVAHLSAHGIDSLFFYKPTGLEPDREQLVLPLIGLYYRVAAAERRGVDSNEGTGILYGMMQRKREAIFPRTFTHISLENGVEVKKKKVLFGDLLERVDIHLAHLDNEMLLDFVRHPTSSSSISPSMRRGYASPGGNPQGTGSMSISALAERIERTRGLSDISVDDNSADFREYQAGAVGARTKSGPCDSNSQRGPVEERAGHNENVKYWRIEAVHSEFPWPSAWSSSPGGRPRVPAKHQQVTGRCRRHRSSRDLRGSCTLQHQPVTDSGLDSTALCTRLEVASHVQSRMSMPVVFNGQVDALPMAEANRGRRRAGPPCDGRSRNSTDPA